MSDEHHEWCIGEPAPLIRPHSITKHRVIQQYLVRYVEVLTGNLHIPKLPLTLVDGFAGGGLYRDWRTREERHGSPLLMLNAMRDSANAAQEKRSNEFHLDVEYFFIEESKSTFAYLEATLKNSEFAALIGDRVKLLNDTFLNQVDAIVDHIHRKSEKRRAIFVLDQFGYADVPFPAIRTILNKLPNAEIILTFATDWLINYLCESDKMQLTLENVGLDLSKEAIRSAKQLVDWRRAIQFTLHQQIYEKSGARFYTPFFIRSKDAHNDYWLIHLSNHSRARDVMVELHWLENTSFAHFGRPGLLMLGYNQDHDIRVTGQKLLLPEFRFDVVAENATHASLMEELPERLYHFKDGVTFQQFFSALTNETPATSRLMKSVLAQLLSSGIVDIKDKTGTITRKAGVQHKSDVIIPSPQRRLFIPGRDI